MPVSVNQPQRRQEEKDPLDTILKGLNIATGIFGIKEGREKAEMLKAQQAEQAKAQQFNQASKEAELAGQGYAKNVGADGSVSFARTAGYLSIDDRVKESQIKKNEADAKREKNDNSLANLLKTYQIQEAQKKAGEIEGPKALAATYGRRMEEADRIMADLSTKGFDRSSAMSGIGSKLPGAVQSSEIKQQGQAERNFVNAVLRRESGAAISPTEFASAEEQYFDRVGDSQEVKDQKAQNRAQAIAGLKAEAGHAWDKIPTAQAPTMNARTQKGLMDVLGANKANAAQPSPADKAALEWAKANPKDPRSAAILKLNGF